MRKLLVLSSLFLIACADQGTSADDESGGAGGKADDATTSAGVMERITAVEDAELPTMALVEDVQQVNAASYAAQGKVITTYSGSVVAPFTAYAIVFDPEPQEGGDYGSFRAFRLTGGMKDHPTSVTMTKSGNTITLRYKAELASFDNEGNETSAMRTVTTTFTVGAEGALSTAAVVTY
jgi:hypothetical protein